jgi:hypothetical protein
LYRAAADQADAIGEYGLAYLYSHGGAEERDYTEAAHWALKSATQGHVQAESYLGGAYRSGRGVPRDSAEATRWYEKAADQGDRVANLFLARAYWRGEGVPPNYFKGAYHFARVLGPTALRDLHRHGWTMYAGLLLLIFGAFAPGRLWGRERWFSPAVMSIGAGMLLFQAVGTSLCTGVWRLIVMSFFGVVALAYGMGAIQGAIRSYRAKTSTCP